MSDDKRFRIKNWDSRQSIRPDVKGPGPWIKTYKTILSNRKIAMISDAEFGRLVKMWLLASMEKDTWGELPSDPVFLRKVCMMDENPDLQLLEDTGLIESVNGPYTGRTRAVDDPLPQHKTTQGKATQDNARQGKPPREFQDATEGDGIQIQELTRQFIELRQSNDPGATIPGIVIPWEAEIGRIHFADGRSYSQILEVMQFSQTDEFWMGSVLTPRDLRQKFQTLVLQMKRESLPAKSSSHPTGAVAPVEFPDDPDLTDGEREKAKVALATLMAEGGKVPK